MFSRRLGVLSGTVAVRSDCIFIFCRVVLFIHLVLDCLSLRVPLASWIDVRNCPPDHVLNAFISPSMAVFGNPVAVVFDKVIRALVFFFVE